MDLEPKVKSMIMPDKLDTEFACNALESLARERAHSSVILGAIELAAFSLLFIGTPKPPSNEKHEGLANASPLTVLKEWVSLGQDFDEYLRSWKEESLKHATPEQREFFRRLESTSDAELSTPMHEIDSKPFVEVLPRPENALIALGNLAASVPKDSIHFAYVGLAMHSLRFIVDHRETNAFGDFLDELGKRRER